MQHKIEEENTASSTDGGQSVVLLTGSTGNLGSYILDILLQTGTVSQIVCLNRSSNALERQQADFRARGLDPTLLSVSDLGIERVKFLQAQLHEENFGLVDAVYQDLVQTVDVVIHNAWPVNFNRNIKSFQPSIKGVETLLRFCRAIESCNHAIQLIFVSSVDVASNWAAATSASRSHIPEAELSDWRLARTGYGQSKLVAERLLARAASSKPSALLQIAVIRVCQLAGPVSHGAMGAWPSQEWLPSLIRSSIMLGAIPDSLGPASRLYWVPVDKAAQAITDITLHLRASSGSNTPFEPTTSKSIFRSAKRDIPTAQFYHVVNPQHTLWASVLPAVVKHLPPAVRICTFAEWTDKLHASIRKNEGFAGVDEGLNPAAKLYDMFEKLQDRSLRFPKALTPLFSTTQIAAISPTIANLPPVSGEWVELWMQQWNREWK